MWGRRTAYSLTRACHFALPGLVSSRMCSLTLMVLLVSVINQVYDQKSQRKTKLCSSNYGVSKIFAGKPQKSAVRAEIAGHSLRVGAAQDLLSRVMTWRLLCAREGGLIQVRSRGTCGFRSTIFGNKKMYFLPIHQY